MKILETDYAVIEYDSKNYIVRVKWHRHVSPAEYKNVFTAGLEVANKNKVRFFLSDIRNQGAVNMDEITWLKKEIFPIALKYGLIKIALLIDEKFYTNLYASNIKNNVVNTSIPIEFFNNEEEAKAWFKQ